MDYTILDVSTLPRVKQDEKAFPSVEVTYPIENLVGGDFVIEDFALRDGKFGEFAVLLMRAVINIDEQFTSVTGGQVIIKQLKAMKDGGCMPCVGSLGKVKNYYVFE